MPETDRALDDHATWRVLGHGRAVAALARSLGSPSHAYLLAGPDRVGKRTLAVEFAKALNCEAGVDVPKPCQVCSACRLIGAMAHPDVSFIKPDEKEHVSIGQVRSMREELALRPHQSPWRVVILRADVLTEPAADALLKTLEEPNSQVILMLTARDPSMVPETVVSRCRVVPLGLVESAAIQVALTKRGATDADASALAELAYGAPGWALAALEDPEMVSSAERMKQALALWTSEDLSARLAAAETLSSASRQLDETRALAIEELGVLTAWWRAALLRAAGFEDGTSPNSDKDAIQNVSVRRAAGVLRSISQAATRIDENVDPRLALEALAVAI